MLAKEMLDQCSNETKFSTPVGIVTISGQRAFYQFLVCKYRNIVEQVKEAFVLLCAEEPESEEDLVLIQAKFEMCKSYIYEEMIKDLASLGIYDVDDSSLKELTNRHDIYWRFSAIIAALYDLCGIARYSSSYQEIHSKEVEYFYKNVGISIENYIEKSGIIHALQSSFDNTFLGFASILLSYTMMITEVSFDLEEMLGTDKELDKNQRLLANIENDVIPQKKVREILNQIIQVNPLSSIIYKQMVRIYGDRNRDIQTLATFLGIDVELSVYKIKLAEQFFGELFVKTEEETVQAKEKMLDYYNYLGIEIIEELEFIKTLNDKLESFDLIYRTVDDIVCTTREDADIAREELEDIKEFMSNIQKPTADSLLDYEIELFDKRSLFEDRFSSEIKQKYLKLMEQYLLDFDNLFCTIGLFKKVDRKTAGKERLLKLIKKCDISTPEKIEEAYTQMRNFLPKVGINEEEAKSTLGYLEQHKDELAMKFVKQNQGISEEEAKVAKEELIAYCATLNLIIDEKLKCMQYIDKRLADFDLKYRTVDGIICTSREGADLAHDELEEIKEFMGLLSAPTSESLLDYEQNLFNKQNEFEEKFSSELKGKYIEQIDKYLLDFDKKFCSTGLFQKVDRKQAGKYKILKFVKKLDCSTLEKIQEANKLLEEFLPSVGLTREEAQEAVQYLERQKESKGKSNVFGKIFKR